MADVARVVAAAEPSPTISAAAGLLAVAFAIKAAVFPVLAWLPASYPAAPAAVVALFSGLLTKVGIYAFVRVFTLVLPGETSWLAPLLLVSAGFTMVIGVLGAVAQGGIQRLLVFHVVSQLGYLLVGLGIGTPLALASTVYYLFHVSVAKAGLLLAGGVVRAHRGTDVLEQLGGLSRSQPWLAGAFLVLALALAGVPPLSGFWAKVLVLKAALDAEAYVVAAVATGVSLLTLFSMTKIWSNAFWRAVPDEVRELRPVQALDLLPLGILAAVATVLGIGAGPAIEVASRAAEQLLDPAGYVAAVLGEVP